MQREKDQNLHNDGRRSAQVRHHLRQADSGTGLTLLLLLLLLLLLMLLLGLRGRVVLRWGPARLSRRRSTGSSIFHLLGEAAPAVARALYAAVDLVAQEGEEPGNTSAAAAFEAIVVLVVDLR